MSRRVASLSVSMVAVLAASLCTLTVSVGNSPSARAAGACVTAPKPAAPEGSHWYYRTDRALQRKCWYLASEGHKDQRVARPAEPSPQPRAPAAPMKDVAERLTQPFEVNVSDVPAPTAEENTARPPNAATDAAPLQAADPVALSADGKDQLKDQPRDRQGDQPISASDGQERAQDPPAAFVEAPAQIQQPTQPAVSSENTATKNTTWLDEDEMRMLPLAIGAFAAASFLAGAILYASGAKRRRQTIVRIVDLNRQAPRMPNINDPGVPFSSGDVRRGDEDGGAEAHRRAPPPWRRRAA